MKNQFNPENCALILIDFQVGTLQLVKNLQSDVSLRNAVSLAKAATAYDMPIVMTSSQEDQIQGEIAPALQRAIPDAYKSRIQRVGIVNAWADEKFKKAVIETGKKQLVMAGITTDICLVFPSISAVEDGFEVQAVLDASGSPFEISEDAARRRMAQSGVVLTSTRTVIAELVQDWTTRRGQEIAKLLLADAPMQKLD